MGNFEHKLDSKGRTVLPAKFRGELGNSVVATIGIDNYIALYPVAGWEDFLQKLESLSSFKKKTRDFRRVFIGNAAELEIDAAGRILLPSNLRQYAGVTQEITLVGTGGQIELWDTKKWNERQAANFEEVGNMAEELEDA